MKVFVRFPIQHSRWLALLAVVTAALAFAAAAYAVSFNYFGPGTLSPSNYASTSGTASRQYNEVWRPVGITFCLIYPNTTNCVYDTWSNPFLDTRSAFNDFAWCWNVGSQISNPTTCQTTHP